MISKEQIIDAYMQLKKVLYIEKDDKGNIVGPNDDENLKLCLEILRSKVTNNKNQFYYKKSKTWYQTQEVALLDKESKKIHKVEFFDDITEFKREERKLKIDALTNLLNDRNEAENLINEYIMYAIENKENFTVVMCDIDDFKVINDTYGHDCGDEVLKQVGKILIANTRQSEDEFDDRKNDIVTRFGGDEFLILIKNVNLQETKKKMEEIKKDVESSRVFYKEQEVPIKMSFGYCNVDKSILNNVSDYNMLRNTTTDIADNYLYVEKNKKKSKTKTKK